MGRLVQRRTGCPTPSRAERHDIRNPAASSRASSAATSPPRTSRQVSNSRTTGAGSVASSCRTAGPTPARPPPLVVVLARQPEPCRIPAHDMVEEVRVDHDQTVGAASRARILERNQHVLVLPDHHQPRRSRHRRQLPSSATSRRRPRPGYTAESTQHPDTGPAGTSSAGDRRRRQTGRCAEQFSANSTRPGEHPDHAIRVHVRRSMRTRTDSSCTSRARRTAVESAGARCRGCHRSVSPAARRTRRATLTATGSPRNLPSGGVVASKGWGSCCRGSGIG